MLAYRLRHRVTVQELVEVQDTTTGAVTREWEDVYTNVPAEVLTGPGKEFVQSGATQGEVTSRINMRWFDGLTQKHRIVLDTKIFNIVSIETDMTGRQEYRLKCSSGVTDGQ